MSDVPLRSGHRAAVGAAVQYIRPCATYRCFCGRASARLVAQPKDHPDQGGEVEGVSLFRWRVTALHSRRCLRVTRPIAPAVGSPIHVRGVIRHPREQLDVLVERVEVDPAGCEFRSNLLNEEQRKSGLAVAHRGGQLAFT